MNDFFQKLPSFYFSYKGRIKRMPFFLGYISLLFFYYMALKISNGSANFLAFLCLSYCLISLSIKRLRDINRSGWLCLLYFIPVLNVFFWVYLLSKKSAFSTIDDDDDDDDDDDFRHSKYAPAA